MSSLIISPKNNNVKGLKQVLFKFRETFHSAHDPLSLVQPVSSTVRYVYKYLIAPIADFKVNSFAV